MPINNKYRIKVLEFEQVQRHTDMQVSWMKGSPIRKMHILIVLILLAIGSIPAQAALVTFKVTGDPDVTGFVQFNNSFFLGGTLDQVPNAAITDLSITVSGAVFSLGNVNTQGNTIINSSGLVPKIVNGGGPLASNGAKAIFFFPDGSGGTPSDGDASLAFSEIPQTYTVHAVRWEVVDTKTVLYFPHVDTSLPWQTEIAIINTSDHTVTGTLRAINVDGQLVDTKAVTLSARGRRQITVANEFTNHTDISYIVFDADSAAVQGYTKFYQPGIYRAAIPAVKEVNTSDIYVSHIASDADWWTGISLVNTTPSAKEVTMTFNNGQSKQGTVDANAHVAFTIESQFDNQPQPDIKSAVITNASGIIGLELFGNVGGSNHLDGLLLTGNTASTIYYPHVDSNGWWTGIVAYNPSESPCTITITPYSAQGDPLTPKTLPVAGKEKYVGVVANLGLPAQTAWFKIDSTRPLSGFELFGTADGNQLAAYAGGAGAITGVFPKIEKNGWTGIAFVNTEAGAASVTLTAYNDAGTVVATQVLPVGGYAKVVNLAEAIFSQSISSATYIAYSSDKNVVGFQLNGSSDGMMLDGLPGLAGGGPNPFQGSLSGTWQGTCPSSTYTGIFGGTFTINIDSNGVTTGTYRGDQSGSIIGNVSLSGDLDAVGTATVGSDTEGVDWIGKFSIIDGTTLSGTGNWLNPDCSGGWSGTGTLVQ